MEAIHIFHIEVKRERRQTWLHLQLHSSQRARLRPSVNASVSKPTFRKLMLVSGYKPASKLEKQVNPSGSGGLRGLIYSH